MKNNPNELRALLVCYVGVEVGIGHLSRLLALAEALTIENKIIPEFLIFGDVVKEKDLACFQYYNVPIINNFSDTIQEILRNNKFDALIFDLYSKYNINNLDDLFLKLKQRDIRLISIDSLIDYCESLDLIWMPSFNFDCDKYSYCSSMLRSGWDSFLIRKRLNHKAWIPGSKVLILTGGSDPSKLGNDIPHHLDQSLKKGTQVHWVRGPFSDAPNLPKKCRLDWNVHNAPEHLDELIANSNYVMTVFGVSFFEVLQYGIPAVVFSPYDDKDSSELTALAKVKVATVALSPKIAVYSLVDLMSNNKLAKSYSISALKIMSTNGAKKLSKEIYILLGLK